MTKARARERAKARAAQKIRKPKPSADHSGQQAKPGHFDPGSSSIKGPGRNADVKNFGTSSRGSARSK